MEPAIAQLYQHLVAMLSAFATSMRASQPDGAAPARWSRAAAHLEQEVLHLRLCDGEPAGARVNDAALKSSAARLTQLAHTLDGLRLEHSAGTPPAELLDQRRLVVFAAWQLLQTLEHADTLAPARGQR